MGIFRHILSLVIVAAFVLSSAFSHSHAMQPTVSADAGHHGMQHTMPMDRSAHHGMHHADAGEQASHSEGAPHCCSMGPCGFLAPASPALLQSAVTDVVLEMTACPRVSVETPPESPPPRPVG